MGQPVPQRPRPLTPHQKLLLRAQTKDWLRKGIIEGVKDLLWVNNTVYVAKKSGATRVCIDCSPGNDVTQPFGWPLPRLQDVRHRLVGARWFTRLDLQDAFFRISVPKGWRWLTAFRCDDQDYQFTRMPFGLKTAPAVFQRYMDSLLRRYQGECVWYLDDILVYATTRTELRRRAAKVKRRLTSVGNVINEAKSEYEKQGLLFAGIWVDASGVGPDPQKIAEVLSIPPPTTKVAKQSALGLVSYLGDHIPLKSMLTASLSVAKGNTITEEDYADKWGKLLEHIAVASTELCHWNEEEDADLYADASKQGAAAILIQKGKIVAVASRQLTPTESRYHTTDREGLGLVLAAEKFRIFLHRPRGVTRIRTDHTALLNRSTKDLTPRQFRWHLKITQWLHNVEHVPGKDNPADFFSRWGVEVSGGRIFINS